MFVNKYFANFRIILRIKDAEFSEHYFYIKTNIKTYNFSLLPKKRRTCTLTGQITLIQERLLDKIINKFMKGFRSYCIYHSLDHSGTIKIGRYVWESFNQWIINGS